MPAKLLQVKDLYLHFKTQKGTVQAVDGVSVDMEPWP